MLFQDTTGQRANTLIFEAKQCGNKPGPGLNMPKTVTSDAQNLEVKLDMINFIGKIFMS